MEFKINDNTITKAYDTIQQVGAFNNDIDLIIDAPLDSIIFAKVSGFKKPYYIPMYLKEQTTEGNVFYCKILFTKEQLSFMYDNPTKKYSISFIVNTVEVNANTFFTVNAQHMKSIEPVNNSLVPLLQEISKLRSELYIVTKNFPGYTISKTDLPKGVSPVATGIGNNYIWDFPNNKVSKQIKELSKVTADLAIKYKDLTDRVADIEHKLIEHMYEEYQL